MFHWNDFQPVRLAFYFLGNITHARGLPLSTAHVCGLAGGKLRQAQ